MYGIIKTYEHNLGFSCVFRQWRAPETHCSYLHGYAIKVALEFASKQLDSRNWVISFGELKDVKDYLTETFDHKTVVAKDDPELDTFRQLNEKGILDLVIVENVGMESFAEMIYGYVKHELNLPFLKKVTVWEHDANAAWYTE